MTKKDKLSHTCISKINDHLSNNKILDAEGFEDGLSYQIKECSTCTQLYTYPLLSDEQQNSAYKEHYYGEASSKFTYLIEKFIKLTSRNRVNNIINEYLEESFNEANINDSLQLDVLDVGCGRGTLLEAFQQKGHNITGTERSISPFSSDYIYKENLDEIDFKEESFDIIIVWHVLEHLDNPKDTLEQIFKLLKINGLLVISVPNFGSYQAKVFQQYWFHLDLPRHLFHFTKKRLTKLIESSGFNVKKLTTFSLEQNTFGFIQSCLNKINGKLKFTTNNHLYSIIKSNTNSKKFLTLIAYSPLIIPITLGSIIELLISSYKNNGASLNLYCIKGERCDKQ